MLFRERFVGFHARFKALRIHCERAREHRGDIRACKRRSDLKETFVLRIEGFVACVRIDPPGSGGHKKNEAQNERGKKPHEKRIEEPRLLVRGLRIALWRDASAAFGSGLS